MVRNITSMMSIMLIGTLFICFGQTNVFAQDSGLDALLNEIEHIEQTGEDVSEDLSLAEVSYVTISGSVDKKEFKKVSEQGYLVSAYWSASAFWDGSPTMQPFVLKSDNTFKFEVPENSGSGFVYIHIKEDAQVIGETKVPVEVLDKNIDIGAQPLQIFQGDVMATFEGDTVTVSGTIEDKNYNGGIIGVIAMDEDAYNDRGGKELLNCMFEKPQDFSFEVPRNFGDVFIRVLIMPVDNIKEARGNLPGTKIFGYQENPLKIEKKNIKNVKIKIP